MQHHQQDGHEKRVSLRRLLIGTVALPAVVVGLLTLGAPLAAHADTIWTLQDVGPSEGSATGTFTTAPNGVLEGVFDITLAGTPAFTNLNSTIEFATTNGFQVSNPSVGGLEVIFASALIPSNSPDGITTLIMAGYNYDYFGDSGSAVTSSSVPEPSSLALLGAALGFFGCRQRATRNRNARCLAHASQAERSTTEPQAG